MSPPSTHGGRFRIAAIVAAVLASGLVGADLIRGWFDSDTAAEAVGPRKGGTLIICGGLTDPSVQKRFVALAGGPRARIVVIPTAQLFEGPPNESELIAPWKALGAGSVKVLHAASREEANAPGFVEPLREATGVWMNGGSQARLARVYVDTEVETQLHALYERGGVIGGSSAGAAILSRVMVLHGTDDRDVTAGRGFDLLPDSVIDMHFFERSRVQRLLKVLEQNPGRYGLGIDAATALEVYDGTFRVLGRSYVMTLFPNESGGRYRLEFLIPEEEVPIQELYDDAENSTVHVDLIGQ
jgi:cyanophycinase